jgi:hypothetical protein
MKKILLSLSLALSSLLAAADEGMWLPMLLGQQVYDDMVKRGLKLTKDQLYHVNKPSIKDAIVIFGGGCTGEIVSAQGLLFTNHHCGYGAIAGASSVQNNFLRDGFYAKTRADEIPSAGLSVQFLLRIEDVTARIDSAAKGLAGTERARKIADVSSAITKALSDPANGIEARISPLFKGNQFLAFVYQRYRDVRLVGTPPESIGKYGGDTDNWEWPRHTGDFSVFRVYMGKDGKPADYDPANIPLKPKHFLPVSIKGLKDGDYAMTYGYPGSTNRYETSFGVKLKTDIENPSTVELRDMRLKHMFEQMRKDPAVKLKLASDYAGIANYWKFFDGESKQLLKYRILEKKQTEETAFIQWAKGKPDYENIFNDWQKAYAAWTPYAKHRIYLNEGILGSPLLAFASSLMALEADMVRKGIDHPDVKKGLAAADRSRKEFLAEADMPSDRRIIADAIRMFRTQIDRNQHPAGFYEDIRNRFGKLDEDATYAKYADFVLGTSILTDDGRWKAFLDAPDAVKLQSDAAFAAASTFIKNYSGKYGQDRQSFLTADAELGRLYLKGIREMNPGKKMYPDATFTMRVSFGQVKSYQPRDAVRYDYLCTMKGVLEKYKPGDYEFDLPANLLEKAAKKDFGPYVDKARNDLVVSFITTNDITGGNSGSPVINANGELVGLAFDGNYEALSHKIAFDKDLNRTICVDVRYVLWCIDKLGGAPHLVQELKLAR